MRWITFAEMDDQAQQIYASTKEHLGAGRLGFSDFGLIAAELLLQFPYLTEPDDLTPEGDYKGFNEGLRFMTYLQFHRVSYTFHVVYKLIFLGYYTEAAILLRSIVETFVRLRYIETTGSLDILKMALHGHEGYKGKKFRVTYEKQFNAISPGLYEIYRLLCEISHGNIASNMLQHQRSDKPEMIPNTGLAFSKKTMGMLTNMFTSFLLAHLEFMLRVFPEAKAKMPIEYMGKMDTVMERIWKVIEEYHTDPELNYWYNAIKGLVIG